MLNVSEFRMTEQKKPLFFYQRLSVRWVIRLGLEPKTPTLKVLCSTC